MGSISAEYKKFMEETSKLWMSHAWKDKLAAGFTNSGSLNGDKSNSIVELATFAAQHGMIWVSLGLMPSSTSTAKRDDLNRLGGFMGALAQSDVDISADDAPPKGDLDTAKALGKRVAELTLRFT
jgi:NAD(P)H dehydrogenase (quinone)